MKSRAKGQVRGLASIAIAAALSVGLVAAAEANNLDKRTAVDLAKQIAKDDCRETSGCKDFAVRGMHRVSRHKAVGKIFVTSTKNGTLFECRRQIVIKLDHNTGRLFYGTSRRRCEVAR